VPALPIFSLDGKRVLVTGGSRGLGLAIGRGMLESGAQVALVARTEKDVNEAAESLGPRAAPFVADVAQDGFAGELLDGIESRLGGPVDIVVHAAGIQHRSPVGTFSRNEWDRVLLTNLTAPFLLSQEIGIRQLERGQRGSHIFLCSLSSLIGLPNVIAYTASKSGLYGVLRNLSLEWSGRGIRANGIGPGYIHTALTDALFTDEERMAKMMDRIPMKRFGTPEDLIGATVFLASEASSYITGELLMIDGGWSAA
jgi:NAD(P)-dependent dehydrogenase (short-subunit alcohol dehydrogenase family)